RSMSLLRRLRFALGDDARQIPWLIIQMTAVALLELLTIGGIPPLVSLLTRPGEEVRGTGLRVLYAITRSDTTASVVWRFGVVLLVMFVAKAVLSAATSYRQFRFSYDVQI